LIKRKVLEHIGWRLPHGGYHSEDVQFFNEANAHGFKTAVDLKLHVPHLHESGMVY